MMKIIQQLQVKPFVASDREIHEVVEKLCHPESYNSVYHRVKHQDVAMPSIEALSEVVDMLKSVIFPGYFLNSEVNPGTMKYYIGSTIDRVTRLLAEQVKRGFCFFCSSDADKECHDCENKANRISHQFIKSLPELRELLALDALAAFEGDPAAQKIGETIFCYPSITAMTHYRIAHELFRSGVPLIPRIITEMAHSRTGIDIHPGARIGRRFFIDHGTGTVIGETCVIGDNVRIYQGVTLGAKSFPVDEKGNPLKGIPRHPVVEDDVIVYSGATILGRVTIGRGAEIGGNVWITTDVAPGEKIVQQKALRAYFENGAGI